MSTTTVAGARPRIVSRAEWLAERKGLLEKEKEHMRRGDALAAARRRLPMVKVDKEYVFEGPALEGGGRAGLADLFDGRRQLIVYHFMLDPDGASGSKAHPLAAGEGCPGCSFLTDNMPHLSHLRARDTSLVLVSRARLETIRRFQERMGWTIPWYSSFGSEFNYDFHVTLDEAIAPVEYNFRAKAEVERETGKPWNPKGEQPGLSVFLRDGDEVFHTYSTYARGLEAIVTTYHMLDLTPLGRQEEWEDSPAGWPRTAGAMEWVRHHDKYEGQQEPKSCCH